MDEDMVITTAEHYRQAVAEVQTLETAQADTEEFRRRHLLLAAIHLYEQKYLGPEFKPGKPAPFSVRKR